jgi:hypothetical protein
MSEIFDNSVNILMTVSFILIILYMLFLIPTQTISKGSRLAGHQVGFKENKECDNIWCNK